MTPLLLGCFGFMDKVGWASDSRYFCYLYQTTISFRNTTEMFADLPERLDFSSSVVLNMVCDMADDAHRERVQ